MTLSTDPLLARFHNEPALICETQLPWFEACATKASAALAEIEAHVRATDDFWGAEDSYLSRVRPYRVVDGILHVPVKGILLHNFPYSISNWATGYEYIWEAVRRGLGDSDVDGIALIVDSPGGTVAGMFDLTDKIYDRRGEKPIRSFATDSAYSAAYAIASVADAITVSRTGGVGSIGVVVVQTEVSRNLDAHGVTVSIIRSKPTKMEGNLYEPLSKGAKKRIQAKVDNIHQQFVATVARNRGMDEAAVDATDALTFMAQDAIDEGLADHIGSLDDSITAFVASLNSDKGDDPMATKPQAETILMADHDIAVTEAKAAGVAEGHAAGMSAERARVTAILDSDEGKARPVVAFSTATKTSMATDEAIAFLGTLPKETAEAPKAKAEGGAGAPAGMLEAAMNGSGNPDLGAGSDDGPELETDAQLSTDIQNFGLAGFKPKETN